jgi:hypothetical protein
MSVGTWHHVSSLHAVKPVIRPNQLPAPAANAVVVQNWNRFCNSFNILCSIATFVLLGDRKLLDMWEALFLPPLLSAVCCTAPLYCPTVLPHCTAPLYCPTVLPHCTAPLYCSTAVCADGPRLCRPRSRPAASPPDHRWGHGNAWWTPGRGTGPSSSSSSSQRSSGGCSSCRPGRPLHLIPGEQLLGICQQQFDQRELPTGAVHGSGGQPPPGGGGWSHGGWNPHGICRGS